MDSLTSVTSSQSTTTSTTSTAASTTPSDYMTFLRMLTTQLQYQDPLDPVDSSDYAAQLANFSAVEQQVETNSLLTALNDRFDLLGMAQLSGWVGQEALTTADVQFDGTPITLHPTPDEDATSAVLVVRDSSGTVVARETIPIDGAPYLWLGADAKGDLLPEGRYSLTVESERDGEVIATTTAASYAQITEARRDESGILLRLAGGIDVPAEEVLALRIP